MKFRRDRNRWIHQRSGAIVERTKDLVEWDPSTKLCDSGTDQGLGGMEQGLSHGPMNFLNFSRGIPLNHVEMLRI